MTTPITVQSTGLRTYYLGVPGNLQALRIPADNVTVPASRAEVAHSLISGGTAVTHRRSTRRQWTLSFPGLTPDTADVLMGFYVGVFGDGPFVFIDPAWRNALSAQASTFGAVLDAITEWTPSVAAQPVSVDTGITAPSVTSGVLRWTGAGLNAQLSIGAWTGAVYTPDPVKAPPYLKSTTNAVKVFARSVSGTPSVSVRTKVCQTDGTVVDTQTATATVNSSAWTEFNVTAPAGLSGAYILPNMLCGTAGATLRFACCTVQYGKPTADPFVVGLGTPRVCIPAPLGGQYTIMWARDHGLTLAEI